MTCVLYVSSQSHNRVGFYAPTGFQQLTRRIEEAQRFTVAEAMKFRRNAPVQDTVTILGVLE